MEKREKIIIALSIVAVTYGALDFLILSKDSALDSITTREHSSEIITAAKTKLSSQAVDGQVQNLIKDINTPWPQGVFHNLSHESVVQDEDKDAEKEAIMEQFDPTLFSYSGYLEMADEKFAIINGTDYKIGDEINGYKLKQINPDKIQLFFQEQLFQVDIKPERAAGAVSTQAEPVNVKKTIQN